MVREEILRIERGSCRLHTVSVLKNLYLQLFRGELHGVICGNLEEKNCIAQLLEGRRPFEGGRLFYREEPMDARQGLRLPGICAARIGRESKLLKRLSLAENLFLVQQPTTLRTVPQGKLNRRAGDLFQRFGLPYCPEDRAVDLDQMDRMVLEALRAFVEGRGFVILDDLSGVLSPHQLARFVQLIRQLQAAGMTFVMLETAGEVVLPFAQQVTVVADGQTLCCATQGELSQRQLQSLTGSRGWPREPSDPAGGSVAFSCSRLNSDRIQDLTFTVHRGEVLTLSFQREDRAEELVGILKGLTVPLSGGMSLLGAPYHPAGLADAIDKKVCFVDDNAVERHLFSQMGAFDNLCIVKGSHFKRLWTQKRYQRSIAGGILAELGVEEARAGVKSLPLDTQLKIVYHRWLLYMPSLLVCYKPFSSVDTRMRQAAGEMIQRFRDRGIAVLLLCPAGQEFGINCGGIIQL